MSLPPELKLMLEQINAACEQIEVANDSRLVAAMYLTRAGHKYSYLRRAGLMDEAQVTELAAAFLQAALSDEGSPPTIAVLDATNGKLITKEKMN
jgi:hypothetical protein